MAWNTVFRMFFVTCAISLCITEIHAQLIPVDTLKEVAIKTNKIPVDTSLNPVQILTEKQLERSNSFSVADAVRHFSGVQLKDYGGIGGLKTINVRSLGNQHTGVFYNGVQLGNAQNGQVDLGKFSLDNVEKIELFNGQANHELLSARAYSLSSSLVIYSKEPQFGDNRKSYVSAGMKTGSFGLFNPSLLWYQKISGNTYSTFSTEWQKANGKYKFPYANGLKDTTLKRNNGDLNARRLEAAIAGTTAGSSKWNLQLFSYHSERGLPGFVVRNVNTSHQRLSDDEFHVQGMYSKMLKKHYQIVLRGKYAYSFNRYQDPDWQKNRSLENWYEQRETYLSISNRYTFSKAFNVSLAADVIQSTMDAKIDFSIKEFPVPNRITGLAAFASELKVKSLDVQGSLLTTMVSESVETGVASKYKNQYTPAISASWKPFNEANLRLRGFYKDSFRLPTFNDLYYTLVGSTDLKPERSQQVNFGLTYTKVFAGKLSFISLRADAYQNLVKDKIVALPTTGLFLWSMMNLGRVEIKGFETGVATEYRVSDQLAIQGSMNYTLQEALEKTPGDLNFGKYIPYAPVHSGSANLSFLYNRYALNYNLLFTGGRYNLRPNVTENFMESLYLHDISLSGNFGQKKIRYTLLAEGNNLLNQSYHVVRNYPMPGRSFRISLKMTY